MSRYTLICRSGCGCLNGVFMTRAEADARVERHLTHWAQADHVVIVQERGR